MARFQISRILDFGPIRLGLSQEFHLFCEQEHSQRHANTDKNPYCVYGTLKYGSITLLSYIITTVLLFVL